MDIYSPDLRFAGSPPFLQAKRGRLKIGAVTKNSGSGIWK